MNPIGGGGSRGAKNYEIQSMISRENEKVELLKPFHVEAKVENWLKKLIDSMKETLRNKFFKYMSEQVPAKKTLDKDKLARVVKAHPGQVLLTFAQINWTTDVEVALISLEKGEGPSALKKCRQNYKKKVENYVELVERSNIQKLERLKIVALIIMDEHNREIIEKLSSQKVTSPKDFEWLQQLRFRRANMDGENDQ